MLQMHGQIEIPELFLFRPPCHHRRFVRIRKSEKQKQKIKQVETKN